MYVNDPVSFDQSDWVLTSLVQVINLLFVAFYIACIE